ncbi:MAG: TonB-dependent receptor [Chloroflexi bacterium]|nr:TonB-dependent receptor [Chloroflexota bacterium]
MLTACCAVACLLPLPALAQLQTGDLRGTITDPQGLALPGVTVTVSSPQLIAAQLTTVTSDTGDYRFTYLPPGTYRLSAELQGFQTQVREGVAVNVGSTTDVAIRMAVGQVSEVVTVTGGAVAAAVENTQLSLNIKPQELQALPIQRRTAGVLTLAAGVTPNLSALGGATRGNSYAVDGVYLNEPSTGREEVRHSLEVYQEVQVGTGGHPAEYGNASGALLNVVTKSGGNRFAGDLTFVYAGDELQSENFEDRGLTAPPETILYRNEFSATAGGPVRKDRVWFFGAFSHLPTKSRLDGFSEDITSTSVWPLGKLTSQLTDQQRASVSVTYNRTTTNYAGASRFIDVRATPEAKRESLTTVGNWLYTLDNTTTVEARGVYASMPNEQTARDKVPNVFDIITNRVTGGFGDQKNEQSRWLVAGAVTKAISGWGGDHLLKAGAEYGDTTFTRVETRYADTAGITNYSIQNGAPFFAIRFDPPAYSAKNAYSEFSAYLQDTWRLNRFVTFRPGLRITTIRQRIPTQPKVTDDIEVATWTDLEPRVGVGIDPFGTGTTALRVHYGRYTSPMFVWYSNFNPNRPAGLYYLNPNPSTFLLVLEDRYDPNSNLIADDLGRPQVDELLVSAERSFGNGWQAQASFVYKTFGRFITTEAPNWQPFYVARTTTNPLTNSPLTYYDTLATAPNPIFVATNNDRAERDYKAVMLSAQKRYGSRNLLRASYTWSRSEGTSLQVGDAFSGQASSFLFWDSPNVEINTTGLLDEDRTHEIKFQAVYALPWDFTLGATYAGTSGPAYTRFVSITQRAGVLRLNVEPRGSQRYDFLNDLSVRVDKRFAFGARSLEGFVEVFNPFNWDTVLSRVLQQNSPSRDQILALQPPRYAQIGAKVRF